MCVYIYIYIYIYIIYIYIYIYIYVRIRRPGEPPIVAGSLLWGSAGDFNRDAVAFLHAAERRYGPVFTIRLVNQYLTIIADPNSYEAMSSERRFDFDPIQRQVNWNVFSFVLKEPRKMIKDTGRTVRGRQLHESLAQYADHLDIACRHVCSRSSSSSVADAEADMSRSSVAVDGADDDTKEWSTSGLRVFAARTIFDAIFNTIFGRDDGHPFTAELVYRNFEIYHRYFNYLWLGAPRRCFPAAERALGELLVMPDVEELLRRPDLSAYVRTASEYMRRLGQTSADIKGHNLVYLHVNYNTFRLSFWALVHLLNNEAAREELLRELEPVVDARLDATTNTARLTAKDVEGLKLLGNLLTYA